MKNEYRTLKTWDKKAEYLDELIMKKGPKMTTGQHMVTTGHMKSIVYI